jgi:hypothetical protein
MRRVLVALLVMLCVASPASAANNRDELGTLINRARVEHGLGPLARSSELDTAAQAHSQDMVARNFLDHTGSDGSQPQERAQRAGYRVPSESGWIVVEVISAISGEPAGPLDWWLNQSPDVHGTVLLNPRWREMGVGYAEGGEFGHYWTVLVACRPGVVPMVVVDGKTFETTEQCGDPAAVPATVSVSPTATFSGAEVEVRWSGISEPSDRDWLGLYRTGDPDGVYLAWEYVSCGKMPLSARATGWCWLQVPGGLAEGRYELRLHADDSMKQLASSAPVAVTGTTARLP